MKTLFIASCLALSLACSKASTPAPAAPAAPAPSAPVASAPSSGPVVSAPSAPVPPVDPCANATVTWGAGKEQYCRIHQAFIAKFGPDIKGKAQSYRNDAQWKQFLHFQAMEANGVPKLVRDYGCPVPGTAAIRIPTFGPFTGAQHEIGGNQFLSEAAQVDGLSDKDLAVWLLQGYFSQHPESKAVYCK